MTLHALVESRADAIPAHPAVEPGDSLENCSRLFESDAAFDRTPRGSESHVA
jgi:hypothetical protein